jgi:hypothetical protein
MQAMAKILFGGFWRFFDVWDSFFLAAYLPLLRNVLTRGQADQLGAFSCIGQFGPFRRDIPIDIESVTEEQQLVEKFTQKATEGCRIHMTWFCEFGDRFENWSIDAWSQCLPRISGRLFSVRNHGQNVWPVLEDSFTETLLQANVAHAVLDARLDGSKICGYAIYVYFILKAAGIPQLRQVLTGKSSNEMAQIAQAVLAYLQSILPDEATHIVAIEVDASQQFITAMDSRLINNVSTINWNQHAMGAFSLDDWYREDPNPQLTRILWRF